jgi:amidase
VTTATGQELAFAGPGALAELVRLRQVHPRELVEMCLQRIERLDSLLNAFRATMPEQALAEADASADSDGLLAGVPIAVKDDVPVGGQSTTHGSRTYAAPHAADSEAVRRLRAAGAIPIGITNVPELEIFPWTATDANGITRNPWDTSRTPGGSSGGSAAAVAAGMVPAATGSDGGGSIRIPAASCGLVGMKPTRGRVSLRPYREGWLGLTALGALARTVADSALMLDVMQGPAKGEQPIVLPVQGRYVDAASTPPGHLRVAISRRVPPGMIVKLSADQRGAFERTAALLTELGHDVVERDPAYGTVQIEFVQTWLRAIYEESQSVPRPGRLERLTRQMAAGGRVLVPPRRRDKLLAGRAASTARILALWNEVDVLMTPALATTAIAAEGAYGRSAATAIDRSGRFTPFTAVFNLTGQPAVAIPAGFGADGLPLGVQLVGRHGAEDTLYSLAGQLEAARPWSEHRPKLAA